MYIQRFFTTAKSRKKIWSFVKVNLMVVLVAERSSLFIAAPIVCVYCYKVGCTCTCVESF